MTEQELKQSIINLLSKEINLFASNCTQNNKTLASSTFKQRQGEVVAALNSTQAQLISYYSNYANYINSYLTCLLLTYPDSVNNIEFKATTDTLNNLFQLLLNYIKAIKAKNSNTKTNEVKAPTAITKNTILKVPTLPTVTKSTAPTAEIVLTPEQWGIKFTTANTPNPALVGPSLPTSNFYMDLLPARQSTIPVQGGRDVPNAMPGLNYKLVTQVGKQAIPGFSPVYQNLGIKGMQVTIVGAFTGGDGSESTRKTDTPEAKSKTPWLNSKGSLSLSDNPDRGGKLSELTAYNSYTEFVQLCQQGKHMEVEINLFQVYNQSTHTQIGQDIKLQSKNGNPKFTGIVRSLDVYHATKERTWYTLIMDVTDFGMASKKAINLNNKLEEAIKKAQAELEAAQAAEAQENATNGLIANAADQISKSNLSPEDKKKYMALVKWAAIVSKDVTNSSNFISADTAAQFKQNISNKDTFSYVQVLPLRGKKEFLLKIVQDCNVPFEYSKNNPLNKIPRIFNFILDPFVDISNDANNRANFESDCQFKQYFYFSEKGIIKEFIGDGKQQIRGPFASDTRLHGDRNELKSLWNNKVTSITFAEGIEAISAGTGCATANYLGNVTAGAIIGSVIPVVGTTVGGIVGLVVGTGTALFSCSGRIADSLNNSYYTRNDNDNDFLTMSWGKIFTDSLWDYATSAAFKVVGDVIGIKATGGSVRQSFKQGTVYKSLPRNPANVTNQIPSFIPTLLNKAKANIGKSITYNGKTAIIEAVDGVPTINGKPAVRLKINNQTYQVPIENIANELDNIVPSTVTTNPTNSTSATQSQAISSFVYIPGQQIPVKGNENLAKQILQNLKGTNPAGVNSPGLKFKRTGGGTTNVESIIRVTDDAVYIRTSLTDPTSTKIPLSSITDIIYPTEVKAIQVPVSTNKAAAPPSSIPQKQTTQNPQQPSNSVNNSSISIPTDLNSQGTSNFIILKDYFNKQFSQGKGVLIEFTQSGISKRAYINIIRYDSTNSNVIIPILENGTTAPAINLNDITKITLP